MGGGSDDGHAPHIGSSGPCADRAPWVERGWTITHNVRKPLGATRRGIDL
jgi:hypothetical protein